MEPIHVLLGLCLCSGLGERLDAAGVSMDRVMDVFEARLAAFEPMPPAERRAPRYSRRVIMVSDSAARRAAEEGASVVTAVALAAAILRDDAALASDLGQHGFNEAALMAIPWD